MKEETPDLIALIASRLNHDYVAPLTAISNSCELIAISPQSSQDCLTLINDSVASAISLLQFYRLAFGSFGIDELISIDELTKRIVAITSELGVSISIEYSEQGLPKSDAKLIALGFLCLRSSFSKLHEFSAIHKDTTWVLTGVGEGHLNAQGEIRAEGHWRGAKAPSAGDIHFYAFLKQLDDVGADWARKISDHGEISVEIWQ